MEIIKSEEQKEIMLKQTEQSLRELLETQQTNICIAGVPEGIVKEKGAERICEKTND